MEDQSLKTLAEVGKMHQVTAERVRQVLVRDRNPIEPGQCSQARLGQR